MATDHQLIKSASYFSVIVASLIISSKLYGWLATDSHAIFASLIDSMLDISSSLVNVIAIKFSAEPPDDRHRFGHEKFQDLALFLQAIFFFISAIVTLSSSVKALLTYSIVENPAQGVESMYACIGLTIWLLVYQSYVVRRTGSNLIKADKMHYQTDLLANIGVILSINLSSKYWFIDPLAGVAISLYIMWGAAQFFRQALRNLADEELPDHDKQKILAIIAKYEQVKGVHEFKTRYAAHKAFIQFHIEMDGAMSLHDAHDISDKIIEELLSEFKEAEITIHQDPIGVEEVVNYREQL